MTDQSAIDGHLPKTPPMHDAYLNRNPNGVAFESREGEFTTGTNLKVESEVSGDVHYGTGKQAGVKSQMEAAKAREAMAKTFPSRTEQA